MTIKHYLFVFTLLTRLLNSQTLAGFPVSDYLRTATHPANCDVGPLIGPPDDSMWVNLPNAIMNGTFGGLITASPGHSLLIETAFNVNMYYYEIRLFYNNNLSTQKVSIPGGQANWPVFQYYIKTFVFHNLTGCHYEEGAVPRLRAIDLASTFSLSPLDTIKGIEVMFNGSDPDLAGIYLVSPPNPVDLYEVRLKSKNLQLFPNPTLGDISISIPNSLEVHDYTIMNMLGESVGFGVISTNTFEIHTSDLKSGLYQIRFNTGDGIVSEKFVKEK